MTLTAAKKFRIIIKLYPGVAQLVARMVRVHEAVGSTPATRTKGESLKDSPFYIDKLSKYILCLQIVETVFYCKLETAYQF